MGNADAVQQLSERHANSGISCQQEPVRLPAKAVLTNAAAAAISLTSWTAARFPIAWRAVEIHSTPALEPCKINPALSTLCLPRSSDKGEQASLALIHEAVCLAEVSIVACSALANSFNPYGFGNTRKPSSSAPCLAASA